MTAYLLEAIRQRILDVCCNGRGADGSLGSEAQQRAIAAGQFRFSQVPLNDPSVGASFFSRGLSLTWTNLTTVPFPENDADTAGDLDAFADLRVGYLWSDAFVGLVHTVTSGESAATVAIEASAVALSDTWRLWRALEHRDLGRGAPALAPVLTDLRPAAPARIDVLGGGRFCAVLPLVARLFVDNTASYTP